MAQQHKINGTTINRITSANWEDGGQSQGLDGYTPLDSWRRHTWRSNVMTVTEFDTLYALEGQKVSITTTDYSDRNGDYLTYYNVDLERVGGRHEGPRIVDFVAEFLVRV